MTDPPDGQSGANQPPVPTPNGGGGAQTPPPAPARADPGAVTANASEWRLHWLKEGVTALLALAIVVVTLWLIVATFTSVETRAVTAADVADPALNAAVQLAHQRVFEERQTVLSIAIGLVGVVTGYFFGRVPVERRAQVAETSARINASAAQAAATGRDQAQRTADNANLQLADVRSTVSRIAPGHRHAQRERYADRCRADGVEGPNGLVAIQIKCAGDSRLRPGALDEIGTRSRRSRAGRAPCPRNVIGRGPDANPYVPMSRWLAAPARRV